jgi:hypothetical protein
MRTKKEISRMRTKKEIALLPFFVFEEAYKR